MPVSPLKSESYTSTHGQIFEYATGGFACDISYEDAQGVFVARFQYHTGTGGVWSRDYEISAEQAFALPAKVLAKYPPKPFRCLADY